MEQDDTPRWIVLLLLGATAILAGALAAVMLSFFM